MLTVATASDYGYGTNPESDKAKSQGYASQSYIEKLKSELKGYSSKVEDNGYDFRQHVEKFKFEEKGYDSKSEDNG